MQPCVRIIILAAHVGMVMHDMWPNNSVVQKRFSFQQRDATTSAGLNSLPAQLLISNAFDASSKAQKFSRCQNHKSGSAFMIKLCLQRLAKSACLSCVCIYTKAGATLLSPSPMLKDFFPNLLSCPALTCCKCCTPVEPGRLLQHRLKQHRLAWHSQEFTILFYFILLQHRLYH